MNYAYQNQKSVLSLLMLILFNSALKESVQGSLMKHILKLFYTALLATTTVDILMTSMGRSSMTPQG